jgi:hypothetical protein
VKINEIREKYRAVWASANGVFDELPPEEKTPNKFLDIMEANFKVNKLG